MSRVNRRIVFAGAGTSGHVEPALAVARWIAKEDPSIGITFIGTPTGVENQLVPDAGFELQLITKASFPRSVNKDALLWPIRFVRSFLQTRSIIRGSSMLIGFGGYVCAPAYLMAKLEGVTTFIHEANAKPGMANKLGAALGGVPLLAFESNTKSFNDSLVVGIPLRSSITHIARLTPHERELLRAQSLTQRGLDPAKPTLLVFGGSLGSVRFNDAICGALDLLLSMGVQVIHGVGKNNPLPEAKPGYQPLAYIDDMANAYACADCVISRSGAVTTTETGVLGLYTIYVPLNIGNGEQRFNAEIVVANGGGEIVNNDEFTSKLIIDSVGTWFERSDIYRRSGRTMNFPLDGAMRIGVKALAQLRIVERNRDAARARRGRRG